MPIASSDIKFLLTHVDHDQAQSVPSLSLGGYASTTVVDFTKLFDNRLNASLSQYRCIAVQNSNVTQVANLVGFYLRSTSINPNCTVSLAVEIPKVDAKTSTATGGSTIAMVDTSLSNVYADNQPVGAVVQFTSGLNSGVKTVVASYTTSSHTFTWANALAFPVSAGDGYILYPSPAQRLVSGTSAPTTSNDHVTSFSVPNSVASQISIGLPIRASAGTMNPRDVIYVWLQRTLLPNMPKFNNNNVVLAARYSQ